MVYLLVICVVLYDVVLCVKFVVVLLLVEEIEEVLCVSWLDFVIGNLLLLLLCMCYCVFFEELYVCMMCKCDDLFDGKKLKLE